jgi:SAM-dependent methyltransferase
MPVCPYCESNQLKLRFAGMTHPYKKNHGPFDLYRCGNCYSLITYPLPGKQQQSELYAEFKNGFIPAVSDLREQYSLTGWYEQCIKRALKHSELLLTKETSFTWMDIGAGAGELARIMAEKFPNAKGWAIDFHERPPGLDGVNNVEWVQCDLNDENFSEVMGNIRADLILSITVLEHLMYPDLFLPNLLKLIKHPGAIYLTVPCANSFASKTLGKKWPYLIPGEHLTIPSKKGMYSLLERMTGPAKEKNIFVRGTTLPYTSGYYLGFFKLNFLKKIFPSNLPVRLPTGILEAGVRIAD